MHGSHLMVIQRKKLTIFSYEIAETPLCSESCEALRPLLTLITDWFCYTSRSAFRLRSLNLASPNVLTLTKFSMTRRRGMPFVWSSRTDSQHYLIFLPMNALPYAMFLPRHCMIQHVTSHSFSSLNINLGCLPILHRSLS